MSDATTRPHQLFASDQVEGVPSVAVPTPEPIEPAVPLGASPEDA